VDTTTVLIPGSGRARYLPDGTPEFLCPYTWVFKLDVLAQYASSLPRVESKIKNG
jgi:hypothetical protein